MTIVVVMSLLSASGWGLATYLLAMRRQDRRRDEFRQAVEATHRGNNHPGLQVVRSVPIGSEVGNDDVTKVGEAPSTTTSALNK